MIRRLIRVQQPTGGIESQERGLPWAWNIKVHLPASSAAQGEASCLHPVSGKAAPSLGPSNETSNSPSRGQRFQPEDLHIAHTGKNGFQNRSYLCVDG